MNILLVSQYYPPHIGGLEIVVQKQARTLTDRGHQVTVITSSVEGTGAGDIYEEGVQVRRVRSSNFFDSHFRIPFPIPGVGLLSVLSQSVKNADVVHIHDVFYITSWLSYFVAHFYRKPVFLTQHVAWVKHPNFLVMGIQRMVYGLFGTLIFRGSAAIVVYNPVVRKFLIERGVVPEKIHELRNGVDLALFRPVKGEERENIRRSFNLPLHKPLVLFVGRLVPKKGFDILLAARDSAYNLVFAGSGELSPQEQALPGVHALGALNHEQLAQLYRAADMFALPAQGELFTLAMQEAMASGLPVLTTSEPEYYEFDLNTALVSLVPPDASKIKSELIRLSNFPAVRAQMGSYAREYAISHFDWDTNVQGLVSLYSSFEKQKVTVTTSWDDGHVLDLKLAELLKKYGIKGTFYISPIDREVPVEKRLTDAQLRTLSQEFEVGAHTMTHPRLTQIDDVTAQEEIQASKKYLEQATGRPVVSFCYPAGYYMPKHVAMVRAAGFRLARTVERFAFSIGHDPLVVPTTVHAYRHWSDLSSILRTVGLRKFLTCYLNWDALAIELFELARQKGGVFHLWGHSWEIDARRDWARLERVLKHISHIPDVHYCTNGDLL